MQFSSYIQMYAGYESDKEAVMDKKRKEKSEAAILVDFAVLPTTWKERFSLKTSRFGIPARFI